MNIWFLQYNSIPYLVVKHVGWARNKTVLTFKQRLNLNTELNNFRSS